jgi:hypothetical protein
MTTTDLKPGDIVQHPEKGRGIVHRRFARNDVGVVYADKDRDGITSYTIDLTGWERVETVRPGHVQVRVDDLDLDHPEGVRALWMRVQRLTADPDSHETYEEWAAANNSRCNAVLAPGHEAVDPSGVAQVPLPAEATVTLGCPECGGEVEAHVWLRELQGGCHAVITPATHRCMPDEPTEFGARVTVTLPDGTREKWLRQDDGWWVNEQGGSAMWKHLIKRGTVTIGWDE